MAHEPVVFDEWCVVESWRPVVGFDGLYEVSGHGRVRRVGKAARTGRGRGGGARVGRVLKLQPVPGGYLKAQLWRNGVMTPRLAHVLVAAAFIGPCPDGQEVNHRDGVKSNNQADNLEYLTRPDNMRHAYRMGLRDATRYVTGESHPNAKLTAADAAAIRRLYKPRSCGKDAYGMPRLASEFGVNHKTIRDVLIGKSWKEVAAA